VVYQTRVISRKRKAERERRVEKTDTIKAERKIKTNTKDEGKKGKITVRRERNRRRWNE
jgi:hypothetical protein